MELVQLWQEWFASFAAPVVGALAVYICLSGLDDLALDVAWLLLRRRQRVQPPQPVGERRIAVLVPLWHEAAVIRRMLEHNLASIRYSNYEFYVGVYLNDPATKEAVGRVAALDRRVHLAEVPHEGPTSKADCLNWVYQRMIERELVTGERAEIVVIHDAEDVIHPDSFSRYNRWISEADVLQEPVLAMATPAGELTHGVYCDDFAESQWKDLATRVWLGGFLPGCGVGTAFRRDALDRLAEAESNRIFDPLCLTEDYDNGVRLFRLGCRQVMLPLEGRGHEAVATREYFPRHWRAAVRQRTRWMTGNCLQAWQQHGWGRGMRSRAVQIWFFWRDRKGLWGSWASVASNLVLLASTAEWVVAKMAGTAWQTGMVLGAKAWLAALLGLNLALFAERAAVRMACSSRIYGWRFALGAPVRMVWGNGINAVASLCAVWQFLRARWTGQPLRWLKTEHSYPSLESLRPQMALVAAAAASAPGPRLTASGRVAGHGGGRRGRMRGQTVAGGAGRELNANPRVTRALPQALADELGLVPVLVRGGVLVVAGVQEPDAEQMARLRRYTSLAVSFQRVEAKTLETLRQVRDQRRRWKTDAARSLTLAHPTAGPGRRPVGLVR